MYIEREVTCSDCFHVDVCENRFSWLDQEDNAKHIVCHHFKNKADVVEVRRGEWLLEREPDGKPYCFHCSVCDNDFHYIGIKTAFDYCPNCGAKMDGKVANHDN